MIYLYSRGRSQRGPSFRIPYEFLLYSGCRPLVEQSLISTISSSPYADEDPCPESDESYLYLHAPQNLPREESYAYHVTTRNFFAWLIGAPIVGRDPVSALLALKDRMDIWRDEGSDNLKAICDYIHEQGYGDMSELEAHLPPVSNPTMYRDRSSRYEGTPTLNNHAKKSGSVSAARQSLRRRLRLSGTFHQRPNIANLIRPPKKDQLSLRIPLGESSLATIAYDDTSACAAPSTIAWRPKPKHTRSIGRNSNYTEIVVADYGNGLYDPPSTLDSTTPSAPFPSISRTSPSNAYTRRPSEPSSDDALLSPSPSSSSFSSSTSSLHSDVPSLSSTYSTEGGSPILASPPTSPPYTFDDISNEIQKKPAIPERSANHHGQNVKIRGHDSVGGSEPELIIDALIGELEVAGVGGVQAEV